MNQVESVTTASHEADVTTTYELDGLVKTLVANNKLTGFNGGLAPVTSTYTYNRRRLLIQEDSAQPQDAAVPAYTYSSTYGYDANGHLAAFTYPDTYALAYSPDALGRPTKVGSLATGITYFPNGAIKNFTYGNGIVHTMTQNARRLPGRSQDLRGATAVLDDTYTFDANGNVASITDGVVGGVTSRTMSYDGLDRLITANSTGQWGTATYAYDPMDNLRIADIGGAAARQFRYNYDVNNRLATLKNPAGTTLYTFGYDGRGNQIAKGGQGYTFDTANRLASVVNKESYRYDGLGRRVSARTTVTMLWTYTQDGRQTFATDGRRSQNRINVYLGNTLLATRTWDFGTGAINWRYVHTDALGSPISETDAAGTVVKVNKYEPYGAAYGAGTVIDGIGYTGHVMDQATGLTYMQQRYYDPQIGRLPSVDSVSVLDSGDTRHFNRYAYGYNNPYRFTDPDGRKPGGPGGDVNRDRRNPDATAAIVVSSQAADVTGTGLYGLEKGAEAVAKATPELPSSALLAGESGTVASAARGAGATLAVVSVGVSMAEVVTADNQRDRGHGAVGVVVGAISAVQPEVGVIYFALDIPAQHAQHTDPATGQVSTGWTAVGHTIPSLGSQPYPGSH